MAPAGNFAQSHLFPRFPEGDVLIVLSSDTTYQFHAPVMRSCSPMMAKLLDENHAVNPSKRAREQGYCIRFRLQLNEKLTNDGERYCVLERVEIDSNGRVIDSNNRLYVTNENGKVPDPIVRHYKNVLGTYYNREPSFDESSMAAALRDIIYLIDVAEQLRSVNNIRRGVEHMLSKQQQVLWRSIDANPVAWVELCARVKSEHYYSEALKFLVGKWGFLDKATRNAVSPDVQDIVKRKVTALKMKSAELEARIIALYPNTLTRKDREDSGRSSYANDVMIWVSLCFFRHWFGQTIARENGPTAPDRGYQFFQKLGIGGDAYMDRNTLNNFFQRFKMSKKGMQVVENHVLEIKELVKNTIEKSGILKNNTQLDIAKHPVDYLLCIEINKEDIPWQPAETDPFEREKTPKSPWRQGSIFGDDDDLIAEGGEENLEGEIVFGMPAAKRQKKA